LDVYREEGKKLAPLATKYHLPDLSSRFLDEPPFATVALAWSEKGIHVTIKSQIAFSHPHFPDYREGDSIELFFDTRDVKTSSGVARFCHHFCILGEEIENEGNNIWAFETTRFRGDDAHDLADPEMMIVQKEKRWRGSEIEIFLPSEILHGYDPTQFDRLGFTYRINRSHGLPQYFSCSGDDCAIEQHPSLWASLKLVRE
jgi:hypothetical protein